MPTLELFTEYKPKDVKNFLLDKPDLISKLSEEDKLNEKLEKIVNEVKDTQNTNKEKKGFSFKIKNAVIEAFKGQSRSL
ncbi:MAG: hypothetical protein sL5_02270 [Candidatus Mesenet longicola]|uniref:Uncharacterized protein n=1 Tax=Candidatus Mesenet longicola TaxID=1892558 RepID=A0A8J3HUG1_9RICK|nr:MAG: hypothetical protein sGL2_02260 [Candidatus Mesenet longicola]GHM59234.1 MAG: hypothetical protein sL5_02270 [Candidatus Mesenet longicola]